VSREIRLGLLGIGALGAFVAALILISSLQPTRPQLDPITVDEVLAEANPVARWGSREIYVVGWYADIVAECEGDEGGADPTVAWLQRDCPLRVLMPEQPDADVTQVALEADGLRLAAPQGNAFPSRAEPTGPNTRGQPLVFIGHFDDPASERCVPERLERCRTTFVVTDYEGSLR
jgi:hypothetical protein